MASWISTPLKKSVTDAQIKKFGKPLIEKCLVVFKEFDADGNQTIEAAELQACFKKLGDDYSTSKIDSMLKEVDTDKSGTIDFGEFLEMVAQAHSEGSEGESQLASAVKRSGRGSIFQIKTAGGGTHTFSEDEKAAFTEHINNCLRGDQHVGDRLPLDPGSMALFGAISDGIVLCKLINKAVPDTIDMRAVNIKKRKLNTWEIQENNNLVINAAKAIGCKIVNLHNEDLIGGTPHLVLGLIWQVVKIQLLAAISLKEHPELVRLLREGEELSDLMALPPDQILLRWFNFHLEAAGSERRVHNFGNDLKDSECYSVLLHQIAPAVCDEQAMTTTDRRARAEHVIRNARQLEVETFIQPGNIVEGNKRLNMAFCAQIFNTCPGLTITEEELGEYDMAGIMDDDDGDSREERVFRMWINSLGLDDTHVNNLFEDVRSGVVLLQVMDKVQPGTVNWKRVNKKPKNKFKKVENANYAITLGKGKEMNFSLVGIGGVDIINANKKLILALVWQLMRKNIVNVLTQLSGTGKQIEDRAIVKWANTAVKTKGRSTKMRNFRDKTLATGIFFMDLLAALEERAINWELVTAGATEEERMNNAKYVISVARKIGCCVFLTWEDIVEVKPKMIMTLCASLMAWDRSEKAGGGGGGGGGGS